MELASNGKKSSAQCRICGFCFLHVKPTCCIYAPEPTFTTHLEFQKDIMAFMMPSKGARKHNPVFAWLSRVDGGIGSTVYSECLYSGCEGSKTLVLRIVQGNWPWRFQSFNVVIMLVSEHVHVSRYGLQSLSQMQRCGESLKMPMLLVQPVKMRQGQPSRWSLSLRCVALRCLRFRKPALP